MKEEKEKVKFLILSYGTYVSLNDYETLQQENDRLNKLLRQLVDEETDWQTSNGQIELEKALQKLSSIEEYMKTNEMTETDYEGGMFYELRVYKEILEILRGNNNDR